jgi:hypothetical protein
VTRPEVPEESGSHRDFAKGINGEVWRLLETPNRTLQESERMIYAAYASCYHWLHAGAAVNHQRGEWLIARVYTVLGLGEAATRHARRCMELTDEHRAQLEDFDLAFAHEIVARAAALRGDAEEAKVHIARAREEGEKIADPEDRKVFFDDFFSYPWFGLDPGERPVGA